ncbi:glycosyltransferase family 2 protein [Jeotgalibaca sp. A122]|uniref:glycosyltransferase family 2 protein n=1 Tax=Jeotgalibaca sp. A122 TaxID=3457322 RepID=UPI003FD6370E
MRECPFVSIVLVNYNSAEHTVECIDSLKNLEYDNYEILVVDNASRKEDYAILKEINNKKVHIINSGENLGFAGGNNLAINLAIKKSDYIMLLNNDTTVESDFLIKMLEVFEKETNIGIVCPKIYNYYDQSVVSYAGGDINTLKGGVYIEGINGKNLEIYDMPRKITFATGCCMLVPINVFETVGVLPEDYFLYFEDTDFSIRVLNEGMFLWYEPQAKIYHKESVSTERFSANYQYYFVRNRFTFIKRNFEFKNKITAYPISFLYVLKKIAKKQFSYENSGLALKDFMIGKMGKRT